MTDRGWISPIDRARVPGNVLDDIAEIKALMQGLQGTNIRAQSLSEVSNDTWSLDNSYPYVMQGVLNVGTGGSAGALSFSAYKGNQIGIYDGFSNWRLLSFFNYFATGYNPSNSSMLRSDQYLINTGSNNVVLTNGSPIITFSSGSVDWSGVLPGWDVVDQTGAVRTYIGTVLTVDSLTQITMDRNATVSATHPVSIEAPNNSDIDIFGTDNGQGVFILRGVMWNIPPVKVISGATNATPIVMTVTAHGYATGDVVTQEFVLGNTAANGTFRITVTGANTYSLQTFAGVNVAGSGVYTAGSGLARKNYTIPTRAVALSNNYQNLAGSGPYALSTDLTWRYLGSIHVGADKLIYDSVLKRGVWNYYNRLRKGFLQADAAASWSVTTAAGWQADHNDYTNRVEFMLGILEDNVVVTKTATEQTGATATNSMFSGLSLDAVAAPPYFNRIRTPAAASLFGPITSVYDSTPAAIGYHYIQGMEQATGANGATLGNGEHLIAGDILC